MKIMGVGTLIILFICTACQRRPQMGEQPKYQAYEANEFFPNGSAMRPLPANTIAQGQLRANQPFFTGMRDGYLIAEVPIQITYSVITRGRQQYNIYCSVCHGLSGNGDGMIVQRGFPSPPSFHSERLRFAPAGHFFYVITHGYGLMFSYAARVSPQDRWAIVAYIRALQLSQHTRISDVPSSEQRNLNAMP